MHSIHCTVLLYYLLLSRQSTCVCNYYVTITIDETPEGEDLTKDRGHDCSAPAGSSTLCGGHSSKTDKTCGM